MAACNSSSDSMPSWTKTLHFCKTLQGPLLKQSCLMCPFPCHQINGPNCRLWSLWFQSLVVSSLSLVVGGGKPDLAVAFSKTMPSLTLRTPVPAHWPDPCRSWLGPVTWRCSTKQTWCEYLQPQLGTIAWGDLQAKEPVRGSVDIMLIKLQTWPAASAASEAYSCQKISTACHMLHQKQILEHKPLVSLRMKVQQSKAQGGHLWAHISAFPSSMTNISRPCRPNYISGEWWQNIRARGGGSFTI